MIFLEKEKAKKENSHDALSHYREKYNRVLRPDDLAEIMDISTRSVYTALKDGKIPGAKKIMGWRIPRETFIFWWLGIDETNTK